MRVAGIFLLAPVWLTLGCAGRHPPLAVPGCIGIQTVIPKNCDVDSYMRVVGDHVEIVCVVNGKEKVSLVRCVNKLEAKDK